MNVHKNQVSRKIDITDKISEYDENIKYSHLGYSKHKESSENESKNKKRSKK